MEKLFQQCRSLNTTIISIKQSIEDLNFDNKTKIKDVKKYLKKNKEKLFKKDFSF